MARVAETAFQSMISNSLKAALTEKASEETSQLAHAKSAAAAAGHAVANIPIVGPALAIVAAGATFAAMMAFEEGGIVPGVGRGDIVPAMLTPGEGVVPKGVMEATRTTFTCGPRTTCKRSMGTGCKMRLRSTRTSYSGIFKTHFGR
jgi:hypothetical protein